MVLAVGVIKASLPSYFPDRHGVFDAALDALSAIADDAGARIVEAPGVPMNGTEAQAAVDHCRAAGADFILLVHGGFTMGDVARQIALSNLPMGVWATPEPGHEDDIQLNNFVSLNMSLSIARGVGDLKRAPVQWYFGAPDDQALRVRLGRTVRALSARSALRDARIGVIGGLAPTFYNTEISADELKRATGVEPVHVDMHRLTAGMPACADDAVAQDVAAMTARAEERGVSDEQMALTARAALAMRAKDRPAWINHPMIGRGTPEGPCIGAIADFEFPDGPCTVLRVARSGTAAFAVEGAVRAAGESGFTGCRGWVTEFADAAGKHSALDVVTSVMELGLEHHFVLVPGHFASDFQEFAARGAMTTLPIIPAHDGLPPFDGTG